MENDKRIFTAQEIATYVVCPEAWRLRRQGHAVRKDSKHSESVRELRREWVSQQTLSWELRRYAKIAYTLLVLLVMVIFVAEALRIHKDEQLDSHSEYTRSR